MTAPSNNVSNNGDNFSSILAQADDLCNQIMPEFDAIDIQPLEVVSSMSATSLTMSPTKQQGKTKKSSGQGKGKKRTWKKEEGRPKRPLSAYNLFFRHERELITGMTYSCEPNPKKRKHVKTHGKISFCDLAKKIGKKWKELDQETRAVYEAQAKKEKEMHAVKLAEWQNNKKKAEEEKKAVSEVNTEKVDAEDIQVKSMIAPTAAEKIQLNAQSQNGKNIEELVSLLIQKLDSSRNVSEQHQQPRKQCKTQNQQSGNQSLLDMLALNRNVRSEQPSLPLPFCNINVSDNLQNALQASLDQCNQINSFADQILTMKPAPTQVEPNTTNVVDIDNEVLPVFPDQELDVFAFDDLEPISFLQTQN